MISLIFIVIANLLEHFNFWSVLGLTAPKHLIVSGLMFMLLMIILQHTIFEPFVAIADERVVQTMEKRKRADERKSHAEDIFKSYEARILTARIEALKQRESIALEAEGEERKILESAKEKSQKNLDLAMNEIQAQTEEIKKNLIGSSASLVDQLVSEILSCEVPGKPGASTTKSAESRM